MARTLKPLDIDDDPDLIRLVEEADAADTPRVLRRGGVIVAVLTPIKNGDYHGPGREITPEDYEAFLSSAGSWKGVDVDKFLEDNYESRRNSVPTPVES